MLYIKENPVGRLIYLLTGLILYSVVSYAMLFYTDIKVSSYPTL